MFITPLWILYEILAFQLNNGWLGDLRTGVDFLFKTLLSKAKIHAGLALLIPAFFLLWLIVKQKKTVRKFFKHPSRLALMFLESLFYAAAFGLVVGFASAVFLSAGNPQLNTTKVAALVVHIGSGVYEEFFFRFLLITTMVATLRYFFELHLAMNYGIAIVVSSLFFAYSHYLEFFNEPLEIQSFVFRFLAGMAFSILFVLRGVGITAYTHSFYNILLMFRLP